MTVRVGKPQTVRLLVLTALAAIGSAAVPADGAAVELTPIEQRYRDRAADRLDGLVRFRDPSRIDVVAIDTPDAARTLYPAAALPTLSRAERRIVGETLRSIWRPRRGLFVTDSPSPEYDIPMIVGLQRRWRVLDDAWWGAARERMRDRLRQRVMQRLRPRGRTNPDDVFPLLQGLRALGALDDAVASLTADGSADRWLTEFIPGSVSRDAALIGLLDDTRHACASPRCTAAVRYRRVAIRRIERRTTLRGGDIAELLVALGGPSGRNRGAVVRAGLRGLRGTYPRRDLEADHYDTWWFTRLAGRRRLPREIVASLHRQVRWRGALHNRANTGEATSTFIDARATGASLGALLWPGRAPWLAAGWRSRGWEMRFGQTTPQPPAPPQGLPHVAYAVHAGTLPCGALPPTTPGWIAAVQQRDVAGQRLPDLAMAIAAAEQCGMGSAVAAARVSALALAARMRGYVTDRPYPEDGAWLITRTECLLLGRLTPETQRLVLGGEQSWYEKLRVAPLYMSKVWQAISSMRAAHGGCADP